MNFCYEKAVQSVYRVSFVNFLDLYVSFPFGFVGRMLVLIVLIPDR